MIILIFDFVFHYDVHVVVYLILLESIQIKESTFRQVIKETSVIMLSVK